MYDCIDFPGSMRGGSNKNLFIKMEVMKMGVKNRVINYQTNLINTVVI